MPPMQLNMSLPLLSSKSAQQKVIAAESFQTVQPGESSKLQEQNPWPIVPVVIGVVNQTGKPYENTEAIIVNNITQPCLDVFSSKSTKVLCYNPALDLRSNCGSSALMVPGVSVFATGTSKKTNSSITLEIVTLPEFSDSLFFQCLNQTAQGSVQNTINDLDKTDGGAFASKAVASTAVNKKVLAVATMLGVAALFGNL